jgi:hypothetical protein
MAKMRAKPVPDSIRETEIASTASSARGSSSQGELARHNKTVGFRKQGKCGGCARKVHVPGSEFGTSLILRSLSGGHQGDGERVHDEP